jgi:hypothetical protein
MSPRPAAFTKADVLRAISAAKQAGADRVEVRLGNQASIVIPAHAVHRPRQGP